MFNGSNALAYSFNRPSLWNRFTLSPTRCYRDWRRGLSTSGRTTWRPSFAVSVHGLRRYFVVSPVGARLMLCSLPGGQDRHHYHDAPVWISSAPLLHVATTTTPVLRTLGLHFRRCLPPSAQGDRLTLAFRHRVCHHRGPRYDTFALLTTQFISYSTSVLYHTLTYAT